MVNINIIMIITLILLRILINFIPSKNKDNIFLILSCIFLFLLLIFREPYSDLISYLKYFKYINLSSITRFEPLYILYNVIIRNISNTDTTFIVITSFIQIFFMYKFLKDESCSYLLSLILLITLGLFHYNFYIIRQSIALCLIMYSMRYIKKRNLKMFLLFYLAAIGFHTTSVVYIIFYPLYNVKINKMFFKMFPYIFCFLMLFGNKILNLLNLNMYKQYLNQSNGGIGRMIFIIILLLAIFVIDKMKKKKTLTQEEKNNENFNRALICIGLLFQILALNSSVIVRIGNVFLLGAVNLFGYKINNLYNYKDKMLIYVILIVLLIVYAICIMEPEIYTLNLS